MKAASHPSVAATCPAPKLPVVTSPVIIARTIQPIVSSTTAALNVSTPRLRRTRLRSIRILAITGIAEMPIAVAMKSISGRRPLKTWESGRTTPSRIPEANGMAIPKNDAKTAARPMFRIVRMSVSRPVSSIRSRSPRKETVSRCPVWPKMACCISGQSCPRNEGPSRMPAISSPSTAG